MVENDHGNIDGSFSPRKKAVTFSDCSGEFAIHDYASSNVYQIQVKDESISIAKNGIATFLSALQINWIKNQE